MIQGLYAAANGMMAVEDRQSVIANNIANVSTNGFKRQLSVQKGFYGEFLDSNSAARLDLKVAPGGGLKMSETFTNFAGGGIAQTGNTLDIALLGLGFFHLQGPNGDVYTRNGQFDISPGGLLTAHDGSPVLDVFGDTIDVAGGLTKFDGQGNVYVGNEFEGYEIRGRVGIVGFEDPHGLLRLGENRFRAPAAMEGTEFQVEGTEVSWQSVEISNVALPTEMVNLMMALRAYAANQKVLQTIDETSGRFIDQVGSPS